jgi:hypothetical protein
MATMMRCFALMVVGVALSNLAQAQAQPLRAGDLVILECLGADADKDGNRYLDGRTGDGTVGLAPTIRGFRGTKWKVVKLDKGAFGFECQGNVEGNRWLDGRTGDGTVGLAPKTGGRFTGTMWKLHDRGDGTVQLECLGAAEGPRWLDGVTGDATVQLTRDKKRSGTFWKVNKVE